MMPFDGNESARRKRSMNSEEIDTNWNRIFGSKLTWLDLKLIQEAWSK